MSQAHSTHPSFFQLVVLKLEDWFAKPDLKTDLGLAEPDDQTDFENEVVQRLQTGYIAEDTGRYVIVPKVVSGQIKGRVDCGDWC